ncbi:DUF6382 domain-containing protein [Paenibacillus alkaliterrae]
MIAMQSYRIDFAMNRGHEMTLDRESGIDRSELDDIELQMLHSQRIPYLLPVDWFELDGKVTFRYTLTGMKMLLHRMQQQSLTMEQYYTLILSVTDALSECKHYMLRPEGCLLDEQFIFIGEQLHDIRLAYVPMKGGAEEQPIGANDLLALIVRFTSYVDRIDGAGLKRILQHLIGKKWPLADLRSTLLELIGGSELKPMTAQPRLSEHLIDRFSLRPAVHQHTPLQLNDLEDEKAELFEKPIAASDEYADIPYIQEQEVEDSKKKWIVTAALVIAIACIWRFIYFAVFTRQGLLISAGITLLLIAAILFVCRKSSFQQESAEEEAFEMGQLIPASGALAKLEKRHAEQEIDEQGKVKALYGAVADSQAASHYSMAENAVVPAAEPTVLLGNAGPQKAPSEPALWLKRSWEGQDSKIDLTETCFKIGRTGEQVSYAEHVNGVSRLHLEIERVDGEHRAKDLGSRNGSLLNGQTMIAYKAYKLAIGDVIHLAGATGPSYELKSG